MPGIIDSKSSFLTCCLYSFFEYSPQMVASKCSDESLTLTSEHPTLCMECSLHATFTNKTIVRNNSFDVTKMCIIVQCIDVLFRFWLFWTIGPLQQVYTLFQQLSSLGLVIDMSFTQPYVRRYCCCCPVGQFFLLHVVKFSL